MSTGPTTGFYAQLDGFTEFAELVRKELYQPVPDDWWVALVDVCNSTLAIEQGRYRDVNSVSAATMIAVLNACSPTPVPYVFGGDGISVLCPPEYRQVVGNALLAVQQLAAASFDLELRAALIPVAALRSAGTDVRVACFRPHEHFRQAMFQGGGLSLAEHWLKHPPTGTNYAVAAGFEPLADFRGFECRWQAIRSPRQEVMSLLIQPCQASDEAQARIYAAVLAAITAIGGNDEELQPVREQDLHLHWSPQALRGESLLQSSRGLWSQWWYRVRVWWRLLAGRYLMRTDRSANGWSEYRTRLVANSDFRKCDDQLRMVIAVDTRQRLLLLEWLEREYRNGRLVFGIHVSDAALMTCMVSDYVHGHVHFLDGDRGGYALAARELKIRLAVMQRGSDELPAGI